MELYLYDIEDVLHELRNLGVHGKLENVKVLVGIIRTILFRLNSFYQHDKLNESLTLSFRTYLLELLVLLWDCFLYFIERFVQEF